MSEVEQRFQQRGRDAQTGVTRLSTMIPSERTEDWKEKAFNQLQGIIEQLNETTKTADSIDEVNAALN